MYDSKTGEITWKGLAGIAVNKFIDTNTEQAGGGKIKNITKDIYAMGKTLKSSSTIPEPVFSSFTERISAPFGDKISTFGRS